MVKKCEKWMNIAPLGAVQVGVRLRIDLTATWIATACHYNSSRRSEEFLSLIDRLVEDVLPDAIFDYMGLQRHQIFWGVIMKVLTILTMFLFVFVSLNAFHVDVGEKAASAGSSSIRAALAGLALLGLRNDNSPEYMEKQANIAKARR